MAGHSAAVRELMSGHRTMVLFKPSSNRVSERRYPHLTAETLTRRGEGLAHRHTATAEQGGNVKPHPWLKVGLFPPEHSCLLPPPAPRWVVTSQSLRGAHLIQLIRATARESMRKS